MGLDLIGNQGRASLRRQRTEQGRLAAWPGAQVEPACVRALQLSLGQPHGDEKCDNCLYYLDPDESLHYCWHPTIRILVGADWWCQWWEPIPEDQAS